MSEFSIHNIALDMTVGIAIAGALLVLLAKLWRNPFEIAELDRYQGDFGEGPVTVLPDMPSEWVVWDCSDKLPPGVRMHTRVQVRYVSGTQSDIRYAGCFYWGRYERYPASGCHIAAYRIISN
jgi:hypothetical protein